jgi:flagellar protein FlgJ
MINPTSSTAPAASPAQAQQRERLRAAAEAFEAMFLRQVIGSMLQARLAEDPFASAATDQFRDMSDAQLADNMSRQGSFGVAEMLLAQFEGRSSSR